MGAARRLTARARAVAGFRAAYAAIVAIALARAAFGAPLEVAVACRDGVPNGAYELHGAHGHLRVSGAFGKGQKTGTFIFWNESGARVAVIPYDAGHKVGTVALWHAPRRASAEGHQKLEAPYASGRRHGVTRSWYDNGRPRTEATYEHGTLTRARAWRRNGRELPEADAHALAERDAAADERKFADLESLVASNLPPC